jgi:hypothetical protein
LLSCFGCNKGQLAYEVGKVRTQTRHAFRSDGRSSKGIHVEAVHVLWQGGSNLAAVRTRLQHERLCLIFRQSEGCLCSVALDATRDSSPTRLEKVRTQTRHALRSDGRSSKGIHVEAVHVLWQGGSNLAAVRTRLPHERLCFPCLLILQCALCRHAVTDSEHLLMPSHTYGTCSGPATRSAETAAGHVAHANRSRQAHPFLFTSAVHCCCLDAKALHCLRLQLEMGKRQLSVRQRCHRCCGCIPD